MNKIELIDVLLHLIEYQKINNITRMCATNVQIMYDLITTRFPFNKVEVKSVAVIEQQVEQSRVAIGHIVIILDDEILLEPSYEISRLNKPLYCFNVKDFIDAMKYMKLIKDVKLDLKSEINQFLLFDKVAKDINNKELRVDLEYYHDVIDYINEKRHLEKKEALWQSRHS
jgi:hypothetical protein